jgi:glycosyltransferase involved in cell wall biosynthesis
MRIGIDATALPPQPVGAGNYIIQLIRTLAGIRSGHELFIFAQQSGPKLINLPEDNLVEWVIVDERNPGSRLVWEQLYLPYLVRKSGVELLHSLHYTRPVRLTCKSVVTFHDMTLFLYPELHTWARRLFFPQMMRYSARKADELITVSDSTRDDLIRILQADPKKVTTTHLGVDPGFQLIKDEDERRRVAEKYNLPERFILYVGLVEPRKNLPVLIDSYKRLLDSGFVYELVLVGRFGWMYEDAIEQVNELGLETNVRFLGYVPQEDLPLVYNLASLFVYPTIYEGFGLPVLEAMACGVPVITSNVSSLPEIVNEAGLLTPVNDSEALFETMKKALGDGKLREELIKKGPQRAAEFTWSKTAQLTLQVYQKAMQGS